ncbi:MAG: zinc-binding dehydrogenase [Nitrospirae bacterium]|nr:MAG: zinc-binding dehydrogenase [Nitrospirota bacterium]
MKAAIFYQHGGPEVVRYEEAIEPSLSAGQVCVRVKACALNHLDIWIRQGIPAFAVPLPHIGGCDVAGIVERVGTEGGGSVPGDRIFIAPGLSCWRCEFCLSGRDNLCLSYRILGAQVDGGMAEFVTVPAINVIPIPGNLSFEQAAAFPLTAVTAWHMLFGLAKLQPAEDVLVLGAGSGVGSMAVQMAHAAGARVFTTVGSEDKIARATALGADAVINHTHENIADWVKSLTAGRGVDVVIEHIGPATWEQSVRSLAKGGRLITCGATTGPTVTLDLRYLYMRQTTIMGSMMGTRAELLEAAKWMGAGGIQAVIDSVMPLKEARAAQERMNDRKLFGKIVLTP